MPDCNDTIVVFTSESLGSLLAEGGTQAWKLNAPRAGRCNWVLCVRNRRHVACPRRAGTEAHGTAFLLGRLASLTIPTQGNQPRRWKIGFGEFAHLDRPGLWDGNQNPLRYASLEGLGIDPAQLVFRPVRLWGGWPGMPGPTGYRQARHEPPASGAGIAAERDRR